MNDSMSEPLVGPAEFIRQLLSKGRKPKVSLPLKRKHIPGGAPRVKWIAAALKKDTMRWLALQGGWRARRVVADNTRQEARIWSKDVFPHLGFRFTSSTISLLIASMETQSPLPTLDKTTRRRVVAGLRCKQPATGDIVAIHRIVSRLEKSAAQVRSQLVYRDSRCDSCGRTVVRRLQERCSNCSTELADSGLDRHIAATSKLRKLSPLTLVYELEDLGRLPSKTARKSVSPLFVGDRPTLLTYLDDSSAASWIDAERRRRKMPAPLARDSYEAFSRGLCIYVSFAKDRPDILSPVISFFVDYVTRVFGGRAPVYGDLREMSKTFNRASERECFLRSAGEMFSFGTTVTAAYEEALAAPFVDRTEAQKVFLSDYHDRFQEAGPEVEAIRRELMDEIG